jgi:hypothetical protein
MKPIDEPSAETQKKPKSKTTKTAELGKKMRPKPSAKRRKTQDEQLEKLAAPKRKKRPTERLKKTSSNPAVADAEILKRIETYRLSRLLVLANPIAVVRHTTNWRQTKMIHDACVMKNAARKPNGANPQPQPQ